MSSNDTRAPISALGLLIWGLAALFFLYEFFLRTFIGSVAHQVIPQLHLNAETFAIIGSAYYITYGAMQIPVGILVDKFGVKMILSFALTICVLSTYMFAHAHGFTSAFFARLLMGFGSSFAFVCLLVITVTWFPQKFFGFFAGVSQFIGTMGPLLAGGPLILAMHKYHLQWQHALINIAGIGLVLTVFVVLFVKDKPRDAERTLIFLIREQPLKTRLLKLLQNAQAWWIAVYSATLYASVALLGAIWGTEYLQVRGLNQSTAANIISLAWAGYALGCPLLGAISDLARRRKPVLIFAAALGLFSVCAITYLPLSGHDTWAYESLFFLLGLAGGGQNVGFATIYEHVDISTRATALGLNNGAMTGLAAFIPPIASYFIYLSAGTQQASLSPHNFMAGFTMMPILFGISLLVALFFIEETFCKLQKEAIKLQPSNAN